MTTFSQFARKSPELSDPHSTEPVPLRPHRGISQEKLPLYLGFFEFVHNVRKRGKALLGSLIKLLVSKDPGIQ